MRLNPFPFIWRSEPFRLSLPSPENVERLKILKRDVPRTPLGHMFTEGCVGAVSSTALRLSHYRPLALNGFASVVLHAEVISDVQGPCLLGRYRHHWYTRIFMTLWFSLVMLAIPLFIIAGILLIPKQGFIAGIAFIFGAIGMFILGLFFLNWGLRTWESDKIYLENFLRNALNVDPAV